MRIEQLKLHHFRNLLDVEMAALEAPCIVLAGDNGQGKTNLLEAMYLVATGRSFRHATARQMLAHGQQAASVQAVCQRRQVRHDVAVTLRPTGRDLRVDGRHLRQATQLLEMVNLVAFFPDDLRIAKGSPEDRRRFLDRATANAEAPFAAAAISYARALKARNALLRSPQGVDPAQVQVFDAQLVRYGVLQHHCRRRLLAAVVPVAQQIFATMMPDTGALGVRLAGGLWEEAPALPQQGLGTAAFDVAADEGRFAACLRRSWRRDVARGMTCVGPHRADLLATIGGADVRQFASQGQQRAVVLALKLAEVEILASLLDGPPILLLDDVSSELDATRSRLLFAAVARLGCQVWVSTTGSVPLPLAGPSQTYEVRGGRCRRRP